MTSTSTFTITNTSPSSNNNIETKRTWFKGPGNVLGSPNKQTPRDVSKLRLLRLCGGRVRPLTGMDPDDDDDDEDPDPDEDSDSENEFEEERIECPLCNDYTYISELPCRFCYGGRCQHVNEATGRACGAEINIIDDICEPCRVLEENKNDPLF